MKLINIEQLERENDLLKIRLKKAHLWIKQMGDWEKFVKRNTIENNFKKEDK